MRRGLGLLYILVSYRTATAFLARVTTMGGGAQGSQMQMKDFTPPIPAPLQGSGWKAWSGSHESEASAPSVVPSVIKYRGEELKFGYTRELRPFEVACLRLAAIGVTCCTRGVQSILRRQRTDLISLTGSFIVATVAFRLFPFIWREIVARPNLKQPQEVPPPHEHNQFRQVDGLLVHTLEENGNTGDTLGSKGDIIHCFHGFGASSLSWSPVLHRFTQGTNNRISSANAHDAPGFGLTERPPMSRSGAKKYSLVYNAKIGVELVNKKKAETKGATVLMGHSMGALSASLAALDPSLDPASTTLVLVSPAFSGLNSKGTPSILSYIVRATTAVYRSLAVPIIAPFLAFALHPIVYSGEFWRKGLRAAWGVPDMLSSATVDRYRWPSLVQKWDKGLALFCLYSAAPSPSVAPPSRTELLKSLSERVKAGMKVLIITGKEDKLVSLASVRQAAKSITGAKIIELDCGHVPHEEYPEQFVKEVFSFLADPK